MQEPPVPAKLSGQIPHRTPQTKNDHTENKKSAQTHSRNCGGLEHFCAGQPSVAARKDQQYKSSSD